MTKRFPLIAFLMLCAQMLFATTRSVENALSEAENVLGKNTSVELSYVERGVNGEPAYYVFAGTPTGFAIISANQNVPALLAYDHNSSVGKMLPTQLEALLDVYKKNLSAGTFQQEGLRSSRLVGRAVKPLLGDIAWLQQTPYNAATPLYEGQHCVVGCVPISLGQVMAYHQHPNALLLDAEGYVTETNSIEVPGVKKGTKIDWKNILPSYEFQYDPVQVEAVSNLLYMLGVVSKVDYTLKNSGTMAEEAVMLSNYFGYDPDIIRSVYRRSYTSMEWQNMLCGELEVGRPFILEGSSVGGRHSFVCDGIDGNGLFHINWGWGDVYNGYFDMTILNPLTTSTSGASSTSDGYALDLIATIGIMPDDGVTDAPASSQYSVYSSMVLPYGDMAFINFACFREAAEVTAELGFALEGENGELTHLCTFSNVGGRDKTQRFTSFGPNEPFDFSILEAGKDYRLRLDERVDGGDWHFSHAAEAGVLKLSIDKDGSVDWVMDDFALSSDLKALFYDGKNADFKLTFYDKGTIEYVGNFTIKIWKEGDEGEDPLFQLTECLTVEKGDSVIYNFSAGVTEENLRYEITDYTNMVLGSGTIHLEKQDIVKTEGLSFELKATDFSYAGDVFNFFLDVSNNRETDASVKFFLLINDKDEMPSDEFSFSMDLSLEAGEETILAFEGIAISDTMYYWVTDFSKWMFGTGEDAYYTKGILIAKPSNDVEDLFADKDLLVYGTKGAISLQAKKEVDVEVFTLLGTKVTSLHLGMGETVSKSVPSGLYIVNGQKVFVR